MGDLVDGTVFLRKRHALQAQENEERYNERRAEQLRANRCCEMESTGANPHYDQHLCLRKKGHKGYHMDKETGFSWKWETTE